MKFEDIKRMPPDLQAIAIEIIEIRASLRQVGQQVGELVTSMQAMTRGLRDLEGSVEKEIAGVPR